jgi:hypothetical protein
MKQVFLVASENKSKAEALLKEDEEINRGSISVKMPESLDMKEDGMFIIIDCSEEMVKKAEELLKDVAEVYEKKEEVIKKIKDQENSAVEGFGNILG